MRALLAEALGRRQARLPPDTTCFRWIDDELPGVTVDRFSDVAVLSLYRQASPAEETALAAALAETGALSSVYVKRRPQEARTVSAQPAEALAPVTPLLGVPRETLEVAEQGARFEIRPGNGLSVGLYLDARDARAWVRGQARGRRVLNTFAYTCGFGVVARLGGAARAANLDASRRVLDWGERNTALNGLTVARHDFIAGDAFEWLARFAKKEETFDLVVLDPPGFATGKGARFSAQRDYHRLVAAAEAVTAPGGLVLALCNVAAISPRELDGHLERGLAGRQAKRVASFGASPIDFRDAPLKCVALELGPRRATAALGRARAPARR